MNKFAKTLILGLAVYLSMVPSVAAAPLNNDGITIVSLKANPGALTIQAPEDVNLGVITSSTEEQFVDGLAEDWAIDDARGTKLSQSGWDMTVMSSDFSDGEEEGASIISVSNLTVKPIDLTAASGSLEGVSLGSEHTFDNTSDQATVVTAGINSGKGQYHGNLELHLVVPANSDAANYTATMTFTVS